MEEKWVSEASQEVRSLAGELDPDTVKIASMDDALEELPIKQEQKGKEENPMIVLWILRKAKEKNWQKGKL